MSWDEEFSQSEYQHYWNLTEEAGQQLLQKTDSEALRALLLYQQGRKCLEQEDLNRAIAYFAETLAVRPLWHSVWTEQAALLLRTGETEAAIEACDRALELTVKDARIWSLRGVALLRLKRYGAAVEACGRAIALDPHDRWVSRTLSEWQNPLGHYPDAVLDYDTLDLQTGDLLAEDNYDYYSEAVLEALLGYDTLGLETSDLLAEDDRDPLQNPSPQTSISSYNLLLEIEPHNYRLWYGRGLALRKLGLVKSAFLSFRQALQIQPKFYPATRSRLFLLLTWGWGLYPRRVRRAPIWNDPTNNVPYFFTGLVGDYKELWRVLWNDLNNVLHSFAKTKLPGLVTIALVALASTHSPSIALSVAALFLLIAIVRDLLTEFQR